LTDAKITLTGWQTKGHRARWFGGRFYGLAMKRISLLLLLCLPLAAHADVEAGKRKAVVCAACHGADGNSTDPTFPVLAQQTARYTYLELKDFKEGRRKDAVMSPMAEPLS
jgi:cytochrome c553